MTVLLPNTVAEALGQLAANPGSTLLAGGTDLMVEVNFHGRRPSTVIALRQVRELQEWTIDFDSGTVRIGAGVTHAELEQGELAAVLPAMAQAARTVGSPQIRAAGTIGGNLGTCSPAGDTLPVLAALEAVVHLMGPEGERALPFDQYMVGPKRTARRADEIVTAVTLPVMRGRQGYAKVGVRNAMVISVASACFAVQDGRPRLALGSVGPVIIRCPEAEAFIAGHLESGPVSDDVAREFGRIASGESRPITDHRSTAEYRRHAVGVLARRLVQRSN